MEDKIRSTGAGLVDKTNIAQFLGVSKRQIDNLRKEGLPFIKLGRLVRFDLNSVHKWIQEQEERQ